jgi:tRNA modification GTPase
VDTIFALASGRPPAAVSIIRVSGSAAHRAAERIAGKLPAARTAVLRELRHPQTSDLLDEALVLRFDAPASATGEDVVEFQCHGGRAIVDSVLAALTSVEGLRAAEPGEFTRRAFQNGKIDLTEAEGLADLIEAETETQRKAALALAEGGLRRQIELWQGRVVELSARGERAIDYEEDDLGSDADLASDCSNLAAELDTWLRRPRMEQLRDGVRVVLAGPPNAGKSSLINAMAGIDRAIVTAVAGTTRDHIEVPLSLEGLPIILVDTAGLRDTADPVEAIGVERASTQIEMADVLIWLGDPGRSPKRDRTIRVHAQADRRPGTPHGCIGVSAVTGHGISDLLRETALLARQIMPGEGAIALNRRQASHLEEAMAALSLAAACFDPVLMAEQLRQTRSAFDRLTGRAGVEDMLDALFGRFCLGK